MTDAPFDPIDPLEVSFASRVRAWADQAVEPIDALELARAAASAPSLGGPLGRLRARFGYRGATIGPRPRGRQTSALVFALLTLLVTLALLGSGLLFVAGQRTSLLPQAIDLLEGLETEVVEPGVERVLGDAVGHDLTTNLAYQVATGPEGHVWLLSEQGLIRLGEPGTYPDDDGGGGTTIHPAYGPEPGELLITDDGTVWATRQYPSVLSSFDGRVWIDQPPPDGRSYARVRVARAPDGTVLAAWGMDSFGREGSQPPVIGRSDGRTWKFEDDTDWPAALAGELGAYSSGLAVTEDGAIWVAPGQELDGLLRYEDSAWDVVDAPFGVEALAAGPGGTLWIASHYRFDGSPPPPLRLARFDGSDWEVWTAPEGFEPGIMYWDESFLPPVIGSDGSAWLRLGRDGRASWSERRCDGVGRFDGTTWSTYLPGTCVTDIEPAADGSVWVSTNLPERAVHRIRP